MPLRALKIIDAAQLSSCAASGFQQEAARVTLEYATLTSRSPQV
jgi:hypothetical protein